MRALVLVAFVSTASAQTALVGATLYDGAGGPPLADAVVVVEENEVVCVGTAAECPVPPGADVVDLAGRFITPGLIDAHVHFSQTGWLDGRPDSGIGTDFYDFPTIARGLATNPDRWHRAYLCSGVTSVFEPGGFAWTIPHAEASEAEPARVRVQATGPLLTHFAPMLSNPAFLSMASDTAAVANVRRLAEMGARAIKVWYLPPPPGREAELDDRLALVGREAAAAGLPLVVHATELRGAKAALRAGAAMLVHSVEDELVDDEFIDLARAADATYVPTLNVFGNWVRASASAALGMTHEIDDPNGCVDAETRRVIADAPRFRTVTAQARPDADGTRSREAVGQTLSGVFDSVERVGYQRQTMEENLRRVHAAGVRVATGTDAGNPLTLHGVSIYAELEAMEAAGLSPADVIVLSTRNGAVAMGRSRELGTVEAGKLADLIVLVENPGASASAFRSVTHVMRGGALHAVTDLAAE